MSEKKALLKEIKAKTRLLEGESAAAVADEIVALLRHLQLYLSPPRKDRYYALELLARAHGMLKTCLPEESDVVKCVAAARLHGEKWKASEQNNE